MRRSEPPELASISADQAQWVSEVCNEFEDHWGRVDRPTVQDYMRRVCDDADPVARLVLLRELLTSERELRERDNKGCDVDTYRAFFNTPRETDVVDFILGEEARVDGKRRFHVVKRHAQGGLGEVFIAHDRHVDRDVALKRIRPEFADDESSRNRFIREAEITGQLEHPNIAPVYSLGLDGDRLPFYAMRLIEGQPLHEAISDLHKTHARGDERGGWVLALRRFLGKFNDVCDAVAFAHSRGVLHRDIKPANVILGRRFGETILVDWGLAKRIGESESDSVARPIPHDEHDGTCLTAHGSVLGTLPYMSPEQAQSATGPLSAASDIYSLGATLYHLLTGRPPFDGKDYEELRRKVTQGDFRSPRRVDPKVPRALEAIVLKAMAREPGDRYATATALAADIEHWLADEPVSGWREPLTVRTGRRIRRHRSLVLSAAAVFLVGAVGLAGFSIVLATKNRELDGQRLQAVGQRNRAESEAEIAKAINEFLNDDLLAQASSDAQSTPDTQADPDIKVRTLLDRAAGRISGKFADKPLVEASIRRTIGNSYNKLGLVPAATLHLERALELYQKALGEENVATLETMVALGELYTGSNSPALAESLLIRAREGWKKLRGPEHPDTLSATMTLAQLYQTHGKLDLAEGLFVEALTGFRRTRGNDHIETVGALHNLAMLYKSQGKLAAAEPLLRETRDGIGRLKGPKHPDALVATSNLGQLYYEEDKLTDAERLLEDVLKGRTEVLGHNHPLTLDSRSDLAMVYGRQRRWSEAEKTEREVLDGKRSTLGPNHRSVFTTMMNLASFCAKQNNLAEAERLLNEALDGCRRVYGSNDPDTRSIMANLDTLYRNQHKFDEAEKLLANAVDGLRTTLGDGHPDTLGAIGNLASLYGLQGKAAKAEPLLHDALRLRTERLGPDHKDTLLAMRSLAACYLTEGKTTEAEPLLLELRGRRTRVLKADHPDTIATLHDLAFCYQLEGKLDQAESLFADVLELRQKVLGREHTDTAATMEGLGSVRIVREEYSSAQSVLQKCLEIREKAMPDYWLRFHTESLLGACLVGEKKYDEAEVRLRSGYQGMKDREKTIPPVVRRRLSEAAERLIQLYDAWGKKDKADEWLTRYEDLVFPDKPFAPL